MKIYGRSDLVSIKLSLEDQLRLERERNLVLLAQKEEVEDLVLHQLVELDFRQSLSEMGVEFNELNL